MKQKRRSSRRGQRVINGIETEQMEMIVIKSFLGFYNKLHNESYVIHEKRQSPDFIIKEQARNKLVGVEITLALPEGKENPTAMILHNREKILVTERDMAESNIEKILLQKSTPIASSCDAIVWIEKALNKKVELAKKYEWKDSMYLVIGVGHKIFTIEGIKSLIAQIHLPTNNPFDAAWVSVFCNIQERNGIVRIPARSETLVL